MALICPADQIENPAERQFCAKCGGKLTLPQPGERLNGLVVRERLREDPFSISFLAEDRDKSDCILREFFPASNEGLAHKKDFNNARLAMQAAACSPRVRYPFTLGNRCFTVCDPDGGLSLNEELASSGAMSEDTAGERFAALLEALSLLHAASMFHGNLSLDRVVVRGDGTVGLADPAYLGYVVRGGLPDLSLLAAMVENDLIRAAIAGLRMLDPEGESSESEVPEATLDSLLLPDRRTSAGVAQMRLLLTRLEGAISGGERKAVAVYERDEVRRLAAKITTYCPVPRVRRRRAEPMAVVSQPAMPEPEATRPTVNQPATPEPAATRLAVSQPATPEPAATRSAVSQPVTPEPVATRPAASQPVTPEPAATRPAVCQPAMAEPAATRPVVSQPVTPEPAATRAAVSQPVTPEPAAKRAVVMTRRATEETVEEDPGKLKPLDWWIRVIAIPVIVLIVLAVLLRVRPDGGGFEVVAQIDAAEPVLGLWSVAESKLLVAYTQASDSRVCHLRIWQASKWSSFLDLPIPCSGVAPAVSPDGTRAAWIDENSRLTIRKTNAATQGGTGTTTPPEPIMALAFAGDGSVLYSASASGYVRKWSVQRGDQQSALEDGRRRPLRTLLAASNLLAAGESDQPFRVKVWESGRREPILLEGAPGAVTHLAAGSSERSFFCSTEDGSILLWRWDGDPGNTPVQQIWRSFPQKEHVHALAVSPYNRLFASYSSGVFSWRYASGIMLQAESFGSGPPITGMTVVNDGFVRLATSGAGEKMIRIWSIPE